MSGERISEIGSFWLSKRDRSPFWHITWFDTDTRQTKRASTGTSDLQVAQIKLAEHVTLKAKRKTENPDDMPVETVLLRYYNEHARHLPSEPTAKHAMGLWSDFWAGKTVADLTVHEQERFIAWLKAYKGDRTRGERLKNSYISRVIGVGRAALRRAWKRQEIASIPFIFDERDRSDEAQPYRLKKAEMVTLIAEAVHPRPRPHLLRFILLSLNTLGRPDAILDLRPIQADFEDRLIDLNPPGRRRTKKGRPIVPMTDAAAVALGFAEVASRYVEWAGKPITDIQASFKKLVKDAGLNPKISPYSLRHTMAVELRSRGVPAWEVEGMLGHKMPGVTETYAKFAPDYRSASRSAIDDYMFEIRVALALHLKKKGYIN